MRKRLAYEWRFWARPEQIAPPGDWRVWIIIAGRGWGKTRTGAEWLTERAKKGYKRLGMIGQTAADVRDTMIQGESGVLTIAAPSFRPRYEPSKRLLTFPNGAKAHLYSGDEPDQLRGPAHDSVWSDEPAKWKYANEAWYNMDFGLRSGPDPKVVGTTTPRPIPLIITLLEEAAGENPSVIVTSGNTFENTANLAPGFLATMKKRYLGTRLGRQELFAEILRERAGSLWTRGRLEELRVKTAPACGRILIGVDPAMSDGENAAETGIVVVGRGADGHGYTLRDGTLQGSPAEWANRVCRLYQIFSANAVVAEGNQGGNLVAATIQTINPNIPVKIVHASRSKEARAEPVAALYEKGEVHHVGMMAELEDQLCLVGETLVLTQAGEKPIRDVTTADRVLTRKGWRRVLWAGQTGETGKLVSIIVATSRRLLATAGHPVYTQERGFVPAGDLRPGDTLEGNPWKSAVDGGGERRGWMDRPGGLANTGRRSSGTAGSGAARKTVTIGTPEANCFTGLFGERLTDLFRRGWTCITRMRIRPTTPSTTWSYSLARSISAATDCMAWRPWDLKSEAALLGPCGRCVNPSNETALGAASRSRASGCAPPTAPEAANAGRVRFVTRLTLPPVPVYNLTVEGEPEFYANGFLVHNCQWAPGDPSPDRLDAMVWAYTELFQLGMERDNPFLGIVSQARASGWFGGGRRSKPGRRNATRIGRGFR